MFKKFKSYIDKSQKSIVNHLGAFIIWLASLVVSVVAAQASLGLACIPAVLLLRHTTNLYFKQLGVDTIAVGVDKHFNNLLILASIVSLTMSLVFGIYGITIMSICAFAIAYQETILINELDTCKATVM